MTEPDSKVLYRRLFAGDFPELQAHFIAEVAAARAVDSLAPLVVLVPGHLAGLHLRRELARSGTAHANIRFHTLTEYARKLADPLLAERGLRLLPEVARGPLMKRAVETGGKLNYFSRMAGRAGFRNAVWSTIDDLRVAGLTADDLETAARHPHTEALVRVKLTDIAAVWRAYDRLMQKHSLADRATRLALAAEAASAQDLLHPPLIVYGIDDLNAMERQLVVRLARDADVTAYLPFRASDAYAWSEPLYQWYLEMGFETDLLEPDTRAEHGDTLARVQLGVFEDAGTFAPATADAERDQSFLVVSAPSRNGEVEEILREVVYGAEHPSLVSTDQTPTFRPANGEGWRRRGVLMRESSNYIGLLRDECQRAGITGYFHECGRLGETPSGRALRWLAKLFDGVFRRADVMEFLLSSPLRTPKDFPAELPEVPAAEWNHFSLQAQIVADEQRWLENIARLRNRLTAELERREWEADDPAAPLKRQLVSLDAFEQYMRRLFAGVKSVREAKSWTQLGERVSALFKEFVDSDGEADVIRDEFAHAELFDRLGVKPDAAESSAFIESLLSRPLQREGRFETHEPAVATISDTLGVVFDEVFLCGLVEKEFPRGSAQDPLLLDDERKQLQHALYLTHPDLQVPLRARQRLREAFLFRVALNSARRRVVLSYPRTDPLEGREWLASAFLLRAVEAATGETADYESLERFVRSSAQARRVSVNRLNGRAATASVTAFQYDLARLGAALQSKSADGVADLFCADEFFKRGVEAERRRYRERQFTAFDGCVENDALRRRLAEWVPQLSPARMERYASCPFRYFVHHVLELEPSVEPQWIQPLDPRARGMLLHDILDKFYRGERDNGSLPLAPDSWPRLEATARACFAEYERDQVPGLFLLWDVERARIMKRLQAFFDTETGTASAYVPRHFSVRYGRRDDGREELSRAEPVTVTLGNGYVLQLRGTLDRVDTDGRGHARVIDYTTKDYDRFRRQNAAPTLEAHAARLAAEALGFEVDEFAYHFLGADERNELSYPRESWEQSRDGLGQRMDFIAAGVAGGSFFPHPSENCRYCEARASCGSGRFTRKWEFNSPQTEPFRILYGGDK